VQINPQDYKASFYFARVLLEDGDSRSAFEQFENVIHHLPESSDAHHHYGRALMNAGRTFDGNLHLAYSGLYQNDRRRTENFMRQASPRITSPQDQARFDRFKAIYEERSEFWR
jgi:thioredoxin-like negative regulator of GroEL